MVELLDRYLYEAEQGFDLTMMKVDAVMEAAKRQFNINCASAELKVMQESGTQDDLAYYCEEAEKGLIASALAVLQKIKDAIIEFFSKLKDKVVALFTKKETTENIEKIEKKAKIFPLFGKKKIMVPDVEGSKKEAEKAMSKLSKLKAKAAAGHNVDPEDIEEVEQSFLEAHGKQLGVGAAITVTVGAAIIYVKSLMKKTPEELNGFNKGARQICDECANWIKKGASPETWKAIAKASATIAKKAGSGLVNGASTIFRNIKEAGMHLWGKTPVGKKQMMKAQGKADAAVRTVKYANASDEYYGSGSAHPDVYGGDGYDGSYNTGYYGSLGESADDTSDEFEKILKSAQDSGDGATTEDSDDDLFDNAMMNAADIGDPMKIGADDLSEESAAFDEIYNHIFGSSVTESSDYESDGNSTFESLMADIENLL